MEFSTLQAQIREGIIKARERVYQVGQVTPLEPLAIPELPFSLWVKREDLGPIKAYKWRGAFNAIASLSKEERAKGIFAASAGNHAQGVALACKKLNCHAKIYMPLSTPKVKQVEVKRLGQENVEVILHGDSYDDASMEAQKACQNAAGTFVHPYNDPNVIAGQGTLADEVVMSGKGPFHRVYVAIGGGGLASATACWLKYYWPEIEVIGVEGVDQASMQTALKEGEPTELPYIDVFCDGTAVRKVGSNTHLLCSHLLDRVITVTNEEVCEAVRCFWEANRQIPEPSGAMGLAGVLKDHRRNPIGEEQKVLTILCGANMDFAQIGKIAERAGLSHLQQYSFKVGISDQKGSLVDLLQNLPKEISILDLQYGYRTSGTQYPILTFASAVERKDEVLAALKESSEHLEEVTDQAVLKYRTIQYSDNLLNLPLFLEIEFPERAGALRDFMKEVSAYANLFYFDYRYSGERVGRALLGIDFQSESERSDCKQLISSLEQNLIRSAREVEL